MVLLQVVPGRNFGHQTTLKQRSTMLEDRGRAGDGKRTGLGCQNEVETAHNGKNKLQQFTFNIYWTAASKIFSIKDHTIEQLMLNISRRRIPTVEGRGHPLDFATPARLRAGVTSTRATETLTRPTSTQTGTCVLVVRTLRDGSAWTGDCSQCRSHRLRETKHWKRRWF